MMMCQMPLGKQQCYSNNPEPELLEPKTKVTFGAVKQMCLVKGENIKTKEQQPQTRQITSINKSDNDCRNVNRI